MNEATENCIYQWGIFSKGVWAPNVVPQWSEFSLSLLSIFADSLKVSINSLSSSGS